jgi:carbohydrate-binding DOMON domain-containing protein
MDMKAGDDDLTDEVSITMDPYQVSARNVCSAAVPRKPADPLFKRFAVPKEWRVKDMGGGG